MKTVQLRTGARATQIWCSSLMTSRVPVVARCSECWSDVGAPSHAPVFVTRAKFPFLHHCTSHPLFPLENRRPGITSTYPLSTNNVTLPQRLVKMSFSRASWLAIIDTVLDSQRCVEFR